MKKTINLSKLIPTKRGITKLITILVLLVTAANFLSSSASAAWYDDNYHYRKKITFGNSGSADSNKKVKFDIDTAALTTDKLQADCDDVRFTDVNGNPLKYYLDSAGGACDTNSTDYYVLIPTINAGDNVVYMYYGNPSASSGSQTSQFSQATFTPTSGPDLASEEKAPSPVAYWKFDEGSGTTAQDSSANNNDGTLGVGSSAPSWVEESRCIDGKCLQFDGSNDYVSIASSDSLNITGNITVSAWVKMNDFAAYRGILEKANSNCATNCPFDLFVEQTTGYVGFVRADAATYNHVRSSTAITANTWTHVAVVDNGSAILFYINGKQSTTVTLFGSYLTPTSNSDAVRIGRRADAGTQMKGFIDEPKIYDYARSAAQIKLDFNRGAAEGSSAVLGAQDQGPLSNGLVGYWKMNETSANSCSGGSNDSCDSSGNGYDGAWSGNATSGAGKYGAAGVFDGTGDYVTMGNVLDFDSTTPQTLSAWVKTSATHAAGYQLIIFKGNQNSPYDGYGISINDTYHLQFDHIKTLTSDDLRVEGNVDISDQKWHHVVATYDGSRSAGGVKLYTDGVLNTNTIKSNTLTSSISNSYPLNIGSENDSGSNGFAGNIDEARIYNRALSAKEVEQLYNFAPGPLAHYRLDENTGTTVADASGNGNNTSVSGTTSWTTGKVGGALKLNGSSGYIPGLYYPIGAENAISVSFWTKINSLPASGQSNFFVRSQDPAVVWSTLMHLNTDGTMQLGVSSGNDHLVSTSAGNALSVGTWYHISMTAKAGETAKVYINGVQVAETSALDSSFTFRGTAPEIKIGAWPGVGGGRYLNGIMDDVRVYDYARTPGQVIEDMNASHPIGGSPVGSQVAYWKLDEGYGTTANDSSINSNSLTLSGANWTNAGKFGKAWDGNGSRYLSRADDADFDFSATDDFAYSFWFKSDSATNPGTAEFLLDKESSTAGYAFYANTDGTICFGIDDDTTWGPDIPSCTTSDYYDGTWHHIAGVRDYSGTDKTYIYVDGLLKDSDVDSTTGSLANIYHISVGDRNAADDGDEFTGNIDEIKAYRGALSAATIKMDYNRGASQVLGATGNNSSYAPNAANQEYCVPGDSTSCAAPVAEWKLDEKTGANAYDTSGNENTAVLGAGSAAPVWGLGKIGSALTFDGTNDYAETAASSIFDISGTSAITLSTWVKSSITAPSNNTNILTVTETGVSSDTWDKALIIETSGKFRFHVYDGGEQKAISNAVNDGNWHYLTGVYDGTNVYLYVDGVRQTTSDTATSTYDFTTPQALIGGRVGTDGTWFAGTIDHPRVYNYARTPAQIAWDYNRGAPLAHWKFDECAGATANDSSGNGNAGTITIGATGSNTAIGNCASGTTTEAWNNGKSGKFNASLSFDGTDDYVSTTTGFNPGTGDFSTALWIKSSASSGNQTAFSSNYSGGLELWVGEYDGTPYYFKAYVGDATIVSSSYLIQPSTWYHLAITRSSGTIKLFLNGQQKYSGSNSNPVTFASIDIGRRLSSTLYFQGQIDDVRVYPYALTSSQLKNIYNGGNAIYFGPASGQP